ncbi:hypothetical protein B0T20DRAFT_263411 [Sordaria brevicollis]|uniref:Uncharacterized protein n=1 Tax=Sordaria brevicollis TaxID=83679 RepID=A0AAE0UA85_SORBR|nr:hypothetical protein B0T20DRAFT_263411 [Sordaria brevicollis]
MGEDLHASITRVRLALLQSQVREHPGTAPVRRRRRSISTAVAYAGSKDGVPLFAKQRVVRVAL